MTREEFLNDVTSIEELYYFCQENECSVMEDIIPAYELGDYMDEKIKDLVRYESWQTVRDFLNEIDDGYDWYDVYNDFVGVSEDDFYDWQGKVLEYMDDNEYWDEPDGEEPDEEFHEDDDEDEEDEEDNEEELEIAEDSVDSLIADISEMYQTIRLKSKSEKCEECNEKEPELQLMKLLF